MPLAPLESSPRAGRSTPKGRSSLQRYLESTEVSILASISTNARFTLGKFKKSEHAATVQRINAAIARVPIDLGDRNLSCRTWLMRVVDVMINEGLIELSVPNAAELERRAVHEANEVMRRIMGQHIIIDKKSVIPILDMRAKQD